MKVIIYTTPTCAYCRAAKEFFKKNSVSYSEVNVAADENARDLMIEKSGQFGTPVIVISDKGREDVVIGFDRPTLAKLLKISEK